MANLNFNPIVLDDDEDEDREVIPIDDDDDDAVVDPVERPNPKVLADNCKDGVKAVFPDICPDYVEKLAAEYHYNLDVTIGVILDRQENGQKYPVRSLLERKRKYGDYENDNDDDDEDEDPGQRVIKAMKAKVAKPGYPGKLSAKEYENIANFPKVPFRTIQSYFVQNNKSIFGAYTAMDQARRDWNSVYSSWTEKKVPTKQIMDFRADPRPEVQDAWAELEAGRAVRAVEDEKIAKKAAEERNLADAKSAGETAECGCCFDDFALNRMVQCNGEPTHWFCRNCMRRQAEMNIGDSKHELNCMSMDGCSAGFSLAQRNLFLDKKLRTALERIEQETSLRKAGIENLETCPFCPYAAECPPVEVDKEFRCINTSCMKISCRLCRKETHIPKTCAEAATDQGVDARHTLEEAMSAALIRKCNQCDRPYLKSDGCNKIRCTHCGALQCYVCRKTITDYKHFNDINRGGKSGQCPLFDKTEDRHKEEVQRAEEEARRRVAQDNPELVRISSPIFYPSLRPTNL
ncbi:hypothetical protein GGS26DRAFT_584708 [Hypomontagnella submonticulosa]|nr:hypothetical protein GGS26DRAFT_584708 [Hypomontagnella submonticulosa]